MGKTKIKTIDDSAPVVKTKESEKKTAKSKPKDSLAASLLEQLNKEFGEVKEKESRVKSQESREEKPKEAKEPKIKEEREIKKTQPKAKVKPRGKNYQEAAKLVDPNQNYPLDEAVELVKKASYTKFDGSMELHINTATAGVRGLVSLPFASGKKLTILAFPSTSLRTSSLVKELEAMGVIIGDDETLAEIEKGQKF